MVFGIVGADDVNPSSSFHISHGCAPDLISFGMVPFSGDTEANNAGMFTVAVRNEVYQREHISVPRLNLQPDLDVMFVVIGQEGFVVVSFPEDDVRVVASAREIEVSFIAIDFADDPDVHWI
jgi:hypothetical protein